MVMNFRWISFSALLFPVLMFGQANTRDYQRELEHQSKAIEELKLEIEAARVRIRNESEKEKSAAQRISRLEEEIC